MFDAKKVKDACVQWIRDWFEENGPGCNAVLGISGGKDSSVCAALCVEALGVDRVIGVTMPNGVQPDIDDSIRLITFELGLRFFQDYLAGSVYFKTKSPAQNLNRARVQFRLCESIESRERMIRAALNK